jgi:hypothetical protein
VHRRSPRRPALGGFCPAFIVASLVASLACAPDDEPVAVTFPPRDSRAARLDTVVVGARINPDSLDGASFVHPLDVSSSSRVYFGAWEGVEAIAFLKFGSTAFGDTLAGAGVFDAELSFNCIMGQGSAAVATASVIPVAGGAANAWTEAALDYATRPLLVTARSVDTPIEACPDENRFPERTVGVSDSAVADWLRDPEQNNGLAITLRGDAIHGFASSDNLLSFVDTLGVPTTVPAPRLRFRAVRESAPGVRDTVSVLIPSTGIEGDTYVVSPDAAVGPCPEDSLCLQVGRGVAYRALLRPLLPELPDGVNVHRAALHLALLEHPRFDAAIDLHVLRLTSEWPAGQPADSLVTDSAAVWAVAEATPGADEVVLVISDLVQGWYDGAFENRGLLIRAADEAAGLSALSFAGPRYPDTALRPRLEIVYSRPFGGRP